MRYFVSYTYVFSYIYISIIQSAAIILREFGRVYQNTGAISITETTKSLRRNYRKKPGNGTKLLITTLFLVVNPCLENSTIKTETAGAAVFVHLFIYNSAGDHTCESYDDLPMS
jgi:hypothetical protein